MGQDHVLKRAHAVFACFVVLATLALLGIALAMPDNDNPLNVLAVLASVLVLTSSTGLLVTLRRSDHPVGWLLLAISFVFASMISTTHYANRTIVDAPGSLPLGLVAAWLQSWLGGSLPMLFALLLLLFPTGHPPSARWRPVARASVIAGVLLMTSYALRPGPFETFPSVANPLGIAPARTALGSSLVAGTLLAFVTTLIAGVSVIVRYRRSAGSERQQMKWFAYGTTFALAMAVLTPFAGFLGVIPGIGLDAGFIVPMLAFAVLPTTLGLAILRYRLFDIDRIISRTLAYAAVTAVLVAAYAAVALVPTAVVGAGAGTPDAAIAAGTLVAAALFRPVMRRVRDGIDRKFNRSRYDAERTVDAFSARLREEIDLEALGGELRDVVNTTVQPAHVSLWLVAGRP